MGDLENLLKDSVKDDRSRKGIIFRQKPKLEGQTGQRSGVLKWLSSNFGNIVTVISLAIGIPGFYFIFFPQTPDVVYHLESVSNVFDIRRNIPDLQVLYKGDNIRVTDKTIKIVTVALRNEGREKVVQADYDQSIPFGFSIPSSTIISSPRVISASTTYIKDHLDPRITASDTVHMNKIILEKEAGAVLEIIVIQEPSADVKLHPLGKIAGQNDFPVINDLIITQKGILSDVFEGGILVNTIRFVGSVFIFFLALLGTAFAARAGSKIRDRYLEKKMLAYFSSYFESIDKKYFRSMIELFLGTEGSLDKLKKIRDSLYDDDKNENVAEYIKGLNKIHVEAKAHGEQQKKEYENLPVPEHAHQLSVVLGRFWKETDGKMRIDKGIISPLNLLIELVQERKVPFGARVGAERILYGYINKVEKPDFKLVSY
jgi:hypothetical protein